MKIFGVSRRKNLMGFVLASLLAACGGQAQPLVQPTPQPTAIPANTQVAVPTTAQTAALTAVPASTQMVSPKSAPTVQASVEASKAPTIQPTAQPTSAPTLVPATATTAAAAQATSAPTATAQPTRAPTAAAQPANTPAASTQPDSPAVVQPTQKPATQAAVNPPPQPVKVPAGFTVSVFAQGAGKPRFMVYSPDGTLYVADQRGRIVRLSDAQRQGVADQVQVVASNLVGPSSLAFHNGYLYVGETTQISRFKFNGDTAALGGKEVVVPNLPPGIDHVTRTVVFGPDNKMYVAIGSSCNVCIEQDKRRAAISVYNDDGSNGRLLATGLRNAVGLAFKPGTNELWADVNGRDLMGDDTPPETIYQITDGTDYGWPRCHAGRIVDPQFGTQGDACANQPKPAVEMQAHSAPLGLTFYDGKQFPADYQGSLFVAFHGSWNRTQPTGYKIVHIPFQNGQPGQAQDFATGWLVNGQWWGRPAGVIVAPDGALIVSDDDNGLIYRIFYSGK